MKRRCHDTRRKDYKYYGGRGITICGRWMTSFLAFYEDMGPKPFPEATIERIDNDEPYSLDNCRWASQEEQKQNTRNVRLLTYKGETMGLSAWARKLGLNCCTLQIRIDKGWPLNEIFSSEKSFVNRTARMLTYNGETLCLRAWARKLGMTHCNLSGRLKRGWSVEKALSTPPRTDCIAYCHRSH